MEKDPFDGASIAGRGCLTPFHIVRMPLTLLCPECRLRVWATIPQYRKRGETRAVSRGGSHLFFLCLGVASSATSASSAAALAASQRAQALPGPLACFQSLSYGCIGCCHQLLACRVLNRNANAFDCFSASSGPLDGNACL